MSEPDTAASVAADTAAAEPVSTGRAARLLRGATRERLWAVAVLTPDFAGVLDGAPPQATILACPQRDRFWADPFPIRDSRGDLWIFVEEYQRWRGLGAIVALRLTEDLRVAETRTVLRSRHHFSFPQVHFWDGTWVATVESCDPTAPTYTFAAVGDPWIASLRTLPVGVIDPALAIDVSQDRAPTPTRPRLDPADVDPSDPEGILDPPAGSTWYLTGTRGASEFADFRQWAASDGVGWQEQEHARFHNPSLARPAGNADLGRGLRSVQDCASNYGVATAIVTWNPERTGPGQVLRRLDGQAFGHGSLGTHTLAWTPDGTTVVADVWKRARQPLSAVHRTLEQRHGTFCAGRRAAKDLP